MVLQEYHVHPDKDEINLKVAAMVTKVCELFIETIFNKYKYMALSFRT